MTKKTKKVKSKTTTKATKSRVATRKAITRSRPFKKAKVGFVKVGKTKIRHGVSASEKVWLDRLGVPERSKLIRGFNNKILIVDGYDPLKKIVYEYNGLLWHGSHKTFPTNRNVVHPWLKKTPNQLYNDTVARYQFFHDLGFKVFFVWEDEFKKGKTLGRFYRGRGDNLY